ncbi:transcriptional regulator SUPERMAN-like [Punica granatum]|uniref:C2H2-type domain-containing protein n=2 Tax=Punica granatum TaxID=22663 RepID=A0A218W6K3_PUNGR|nr:transcriptional regulator SUPERMAN-like [Punica granatum]OWM68139.1 hypothetical protein CDL15_Pgr016339 [Punica granatum]PKI67403.1 hypothetical protein CRG98_012188 [Punica granatum]
MERNNSLSKTLKDHCAGNNSSHSHLHHPRLCSSKNPWNNNYGSTHTYGRSEDNYLCGISWPPRSYSCSFCKREFRSAQALGGHMNVHRRDRARLRQSSPMEDFHQYPVLSLSSTNPSPTSNHKPNPNPYVASSATPLLITSCSSMSCPTLAPSSALGSLKEVKAADQNLLSSLRSGATESKPKLRSEASIRVQEMGERYKYSNNNMEMDLLSGPNDDYIDLELRLGCP